MPAPTNLENEVKLLRRQLAEARAAQVATTMLLDALWHHQFKVKSVNREELPNFLASMRERFMFTDMSDDEIQLANAFVLRFLRVK